MKRLPTTADLRHVTDQFAHMAASEQPFLALLSPVNGREVAIFRHKQRGHELVGQR